MNSSSQGFLFYDHKQGHLQLDGRALQDGCMIEIRVFGSWIPGYIAKDRSGWYLQTPDGVGIRLRNGLSARFYVPFGSAGRVPETAQHTY